MNVDPIKTLAENCEKQFDLRLQEKEQEASGISDEQKEILETQRACFLLWAKNIGVFAEGNGSLDYRLHAHKDVVQLHRDQLLILERNLQRCKLRVQCSTVNVSQIQSNRIVER
jgi:hypothetical protein